MSVVKSVPTSVVIGEFSSIVFAVREMSVGKQAESAPVVCARLGSVLVVEVKYEALQESSSGVTNPSVVSNTTFKQRVTFVLPILDKSMEVLVVGAIRVVVQVESSTSY